ncbi:E3 ubiquitin-protein ligase rnf168 [Gadus morhua]|uniref:RING-type E3 ubiquitin transferase n=1 Tax=Gadus morhua TaxID=8049 RepID=A0A8C4ZW78_GADMO|nr:E3 ubiquitin-protein ligase RNF168 [Gadus morhua]
MAPVSEGQQGRRLVREDCLCPVCMEIYLEPVTLPCQHTFCKPCFLKSVDQATLCCPLCRKRISTWARLNSRKKTLVNEELWREVQDAFPLQCQRRLNGEEEVDEEHAESSRPRVCQPGEVRKEYEDQVSRLEEERRVGEEAESRASEEFIQLLLQEEELRLAQERRRQEEKLEEDERLARLLSQELNSSPVSEPASSHAKIKPAPGQIDRFLCPLPPRPTSSVTNRDNILLTPPPPDITRPASPRHPDTPRPAPPGDPDQTEAPPVLTPSSKRGSVHVETGPASSSSKRRCSSHPSTWPHQQVSDGSGVRGGGEGEEEVCVLLVEELSRQEEALFGRRQQEEQDRLVAELLQKELNKEEQRAFTDRSKGSADPYQLRRKARTPSRTSSSSSSSKRNEVGAERRATPNRQTASSSSSGPAPHLPGANKQASLKDMFRRLSN